MLKLYAVTHKKEEKYAKGRILVGVGANKNIEGVDVYDNTGDNIADKNKHFCELTALYWIWKNTNDEAVGLEHYRRFFAREKFFYYRPMKVSEMERVLLKYDIILPRKATMGSSIYSNYEQFHYKTDMDVCGEIIKEKYPDFVADFDAVMKESKAHMANVFVASKKLADEYCEWIFTILFEAEKRIDYSDRDAYQQRVFGFLSERLFNVWIHHKNLKVKYEHLRGFGEGGRLFRVIKRTLNKFKRQKKD